MEAARAARINVQKDRFSRKKEARKAFLLGDFLLYFLHEQRSEKLKESRA